MAEKRGPWSIVSAREAYDNRWIRVTHHDVITPSGDPGIYGTIHYKNRALGIVPVDAQQHTYLVGQYRFALDAYSWEIPEGAARSMSISWSRPSASCWRKQGCARGAGTSCSSPTSPIR